MNTHIDTLKEMTIGQIKQLTNESKLGRRIIKMDIKTEAQNMPDQIEQKESVKLIKNTKGDNWEIKLLEINLDRLEELNNIMISKFEKEEK